MTQKVLSQLPSPQFFSICTALFVTVLCYDLSVSVCLAQPAQNFEGGKFIGLSSGAPRIRQEEGGTTGGLGAEPLVATDFYKNTHLA